MAYIYYNANPKGRNVFDCAVRSISTATNKPYKKVFRELSENALDMGLMLENVESIEDYLDGRYPRTCHYAKTLGELADEFPIRELHRFNEQSFILYN